MKGTIIKCLEETVKRAYGDARWREILEATGEDRNRIYMTTEDVPDAHFRELLAATCKTLNISAEQAMDAFGEHWSTVYAPSIYGVYFKKCRTTREFLLKLDSVHEAITRNMARASPPKFEFDDSQPGRLVMRYSSSRKLVALMPGLIRGVAKYYGERVNVSVKGNDVTIEFEA